jgi:hypothetical protein
VWNLWGRTGVFWVLVGKPEGRRPLGTPRLRWEDNVKIDLQLVGCEGMEWIVPFYDRYRCWTLINVVMNLGVP